MTTHISITMATKVIMTSKRRLRDGLLSAAVGNITVAMNTDLGHHLTYNSRGALYSERSMAYSVCEAPLEL